MVASDAALDLIKKFEGFAESAYVCPGGELTIGYGHTEGVKEGDIITKAEAEAFLRYDIKKTEEAINKYVKVKLLQHQFDALVSLVFNIGESNFRRSTLLALLNEGKAQEACIQFRRWIFANGKAQQGLIKRRHAEQALFCGSPTLGI